MEQDNPGRRAASRAAHVLRMIGTTLLAAIVIRPAALWTGRA